MSVASSCESPSFSHQLSFPQSDALPGFGEYENSGCLSLCQAASKAQAIGLMILYAFGAALTAAAAVVAATFLSIAAAGALLATALAGTSAIFVIFALKSCLDYLAISKGPSTATLGLNASDQGSLPLGELSEPINSGIVCEDSTVSTAWKLKLIETAQHSIAISGCDCGETIFDTVLDKIDEKMRAIDHFKAYILTSDMFITPSNNQKIADLARRYPDRFNLVRTSRVIHVNPGLAFSSNHTKMIIQDQGKAVLIGGSLLDDKNALNTGEIPSENVATDDTPSSCIHHMIARGFRDMDFVLQSPDENGFGKTLYLEFLKLMTRWKYYSTSEWDTQLFHPIDQDVSDAEPVQLLQDNPKRVDRIACKVYATGPEHTENTFLRELIRQIGEASHDIYIAHLYFHPTGDLMQALINASNRGVKIHIVTNGNVSGLSPSGHAYFVDKSHYNFRYLLQQGNAENISYHEYVVKDTSLHKKIFVIDNQTVVAGSGNCSFKSLNMFDYEVNMFMSSPELAEKTLEVIRRDIEIATPVNVPSEERGSIPLCLRMSACFQGLLAPFIG